MISRSIITLSFFVSALQADITVQEYNALKTEFTALHGSTIFPVFGKTFDDIDSTFGPRHQHSTDRYDFHRGIDVDGTEGDNILAITGGRFWEYREFSAGGHTVILQHDFANPVTLNGNNYDHYYTYYMHLYDDGIQGNGVGTLDMITDQGWVEEKNNQGQGTVFNAGDHIGELGNSGSSGGLAYADHLHMEVRVGTTNSLIYQTDNPGSTQHGFDPHLHPLLFFADPNATASLSSNSIVDGNSDVEILYSIADESPVLNRIEVTLTDTDSDQEVDSHILDFNLRTGIDATSFDTLDDPDENFPYIDPIAFGDNSTTFETGIVISQEWLADAPANFQIDISAFDIWGNESQISLASVPEPRLAALFGGIAAFCCACFRRQRRKIGE